MKQKIILFTVAIVLVLGFASCNDSSYLNAIPTRSTALLRIDPAQGGDNALPLKTLLQQNSLDNCGIDLSQPVVIFTAPDGNLGLCAKVKDQGDVKKLFEKQAAKLRCRTMADRRDCHFAAFGQWLIGASEDALLVMGPVNAVDVPALQTLMTRYLTQDEDKGITISPLYERLDTMTAPMTLVARVQALPEKLVAPLTLGMPKEADASQVVLAAKVKNDNGLLSLDGETYSTNKQVDDSLKAARKAYGKVSERYLRGMSRSDVFGFFTNVQGPAFLSQMQADRNVQAMLAGMNAAIDMDNIIRSVNGDLAIVAPSLAEGSMRLAMTAQLANSSWLKDVAYWKQSVPRGASITDAGTNCYRYTDGNMQFFFGVSQDKQFYSGNTAEEALSRLKTSATPLSAAVTKAAQGGRIAIVLQFSTSKPELAAVSKIIEPVFGSVNSIVFRIK